MSTDAGDEAILSELAASGDRPRVVYRGSGDSYILVEYGPLVLDLLLRFRVHALMQWLQSRQLPGIIDLTPGIRSLQVHFDSGQVHLKELLDLLLTAENELPLHCAKPFPSPSRPSISGMRLVTVPVRHSLTQGP